MQQNQNMFSTHFFGHSFPSAKCHFQQIIFSGQNFGASQYFRINIINYWAIVSNANFNFPQLDKIKAFIYKKKKTYIHTYIHTYIYIYIYIRMYFLQHNVTSGTICWVVRISDRRGTSVCSETKNSFRHWFLELVKSDAGVYSRPLEAVTLTKWKWDAHHLNSGTN